jgi:hypothetical protein
MENSLGEIFCMAIKGGRRMDAQALIIWLIVGGVGGVAGWLAGMVVSCPGRSGETLAGLSSRQTQLYR